MMTYTYQFSGQIAVNADSESEAFEQVDELRVQRAQESR